MQARLLVLHDKANIKHVKLLPVTLIGRSTECNLKIASSQVSRNHCRITVNQDSVCVEDLGSANGTLINGQPIEPNKVIPVIPGTRLTVGPAEFQFDFATNTAATVVLPSTRPKPQSLLPGTDVIPPAGDGLTDAISPAVGSAQPAVPARRPLADTRVEVPQVVLLDSNDSDRENLEYQSGLGTTAPIPSVLPASSPVPAVPSPVPAKPVSAAAVVSKAVASAPVPVPAVAPVATAVVAAAIPVLKGGAETVKPAVAAPVVAPALPVKARPVAPPAAPTATPVARVVAPAAPAIADIDEPESGFVVAQQANENPFDFFSEAPAEGIAVEEAAGEESPFQFDGPSEGVTTTSGPASTTPKKSGLKSLFSLFGKKPAQPGKPSKSSSSPEETAGSDSPFGSDSPPALADEPFMGFGATEESPAAVESPDIDTAVPAIAEPEPTPPAEAAEPDPFQDFLGKL